MAKLPVLSAREIIRALERAGFGQVSQRGSHIKLRRGDRTAIVPRYPEVPRGVLVSILRQAGLERDEFLRLLR
ncbi:MAG: type II toxin-antitoxin system HicA family toxin [Euryarchaeota archaeon]|nr:type II toxin-antitoxin system HicA family toxin [Euryarchaeota archaeon]